MANVFIRELNLLARTQVIMQDGEQTTLTKDNDVFSFAVSLAFIYRHHE